MIKNRFFNSDKSNRRRLKFAAVALFLLTFAFAPDAAVSAKTAHRFHSSLTRIDYDSDAKNIKITIQLITHDVLEVLEKIAGKPVELENSKEVDVLIQNYLAEHFVMRDKNGKQLELKWVGKETDFDRTFVYLEIPSDQSIEGFDLSNTMFFETYPVQTNIIIARFNGEKADLLFKAKDGFKTIEAKNKESVKDES